MHHNPAKNVLWVAMLPEEVASKMGRKVEDVIELLASAKTKMYAARLKRPTPFVDKTVYVSWNAMCVSAYFQAAQVLGLEDARKFALRSLDRILSEAWNDERGLSHVIAYADPNAETRFVRRLARRLRLHRHRLSRCTSGPGLALTFLLVVPLLFAVPIALAAAEMTTIMPVEGGFYRWTRAALGEFWGFHCGWWNWTGTFLMSASYGVAMADYLNAWVPLHSRLEHWVVACLFLVLVVAAINVFGIRLVGNLTLVLLVRRSSP